MTKGYDALLDDLSAYNERTKTATETYEQSLVSIVAATQEVVSERDNANKWASAPEDELVEDGTNTPDYSANHYAKKAEATSQGVVDLVQDATDQAAIAKDQAEEATNQAGIAAANHILMTEAQSRAIQSLNENRYAASGMVHMGNGRADGTSNGTSINQGLWSRTVSSDYANQLLLGLDPTSSASTVQTTSKTDFAVTHIAGAVVNIIQGSARSGSRDGFAFELPPAPDGTVIYDSTGDARGSGKANLDLKVDVDPKYGDVAADTNEAVARAFEGAAKNGDFRLGSTGWNPDPSMSISAGRLTWDNSSGRSEYLHQALNIAPVGETFKVTVIVENLVGTLKVSFGDGSSVSHELVNGVNTITDVSVTASNIYLAMLDGSSGSITTFAIQKVTEEVVTHPVDLAMFEYYEEELTGRQEIFECIQSLSTTFGDTDVPTVLSTRPKSYFQQYDGQFSDPDAQNDTYRCVVWSDLTDEQKRKVAAYMGEKLFMGENGNIVNGRLRARTIRGLGNGDWEHFDSNVGTNPLQSQSPYGRVMPQGALDTYPANSYSNGYQPYSGLQSVVGGHKGVYTQGKNLVEDPNTYKGRCFAYVVATVPRANQGAYHEDLNPYGTSRFWRTTGGSNADWYHSDLAGLINTRADCFNYHLTNNGGAPTVIGSVCAFQYGGKIGSTSGHPDGIFYDGIEAGGLNGVIDWRCPAEEMQSQWLYAERKHECAKYRGVEILADNTSVSGKFMHTYTETVGGSITLPRKCLDSTVECVHSSDGGATWTKTNPSVNQVNNTVTLPVGGESVVSFHTYAKQTTSSTNAPVVSGTFGLGTVMVQNSHETKKGVLLRESVTGVISTGTEYTNLGILRSTIVDELVIDYETMTYTPEAGGAQLQSQLVEENGQLFIQYHDGTIYHRSAIPIGWANQRARVGGENVPA